MTPTDWENAARGWEVEAKFYRGCFWLVVSIAIFYMVLV